MYAGFLGEKVETYFDNSNTIRSVKDSSIYHPTMTQSEDSSSVSPEPQDSVLVPEDDSRGKHLSATFR